MAHIELVEPQVIVSALVHHIAAAVVADDVELRDRLANGVAVLLGADVADVINSARELLAVIADEDAEAFEAEVLADIAAL